MHASLVRTPLSLRGSSRDISFFAPPPPYPSMCRATRRALLHITWLHVCISDLPRILSFTHWRWRSKLYFVATRPQSLKVVSLASDSQFLGPKFMLYIHVYVISIRYVGHICLLKTGYKCSNVNWTRLLYSRHHWSVLEGKWFQLKSYHVINLIKV